MTSLYKISIPGSNIGNVWAKMENQNPTRTHKDRSLGPWIEHYAKKGVKELVISSSGNSARSAEKFCREKGLKLYIFERKNTPTPKKDAFRFAKKKNIPYLRASTDDKALVGYQDIAFELMRQLPKIDNIFIPTSSGATLEGVHLGFREKLSGSDPDSLDVPAFYAVQTTKVHPIAREFDSDFKKEKRSGATAIVDNIAHRKDGVIKILEETGGGGFVISNQELEEARVLLMNQKGWPRTSWCRASQTPSGAWQSTLAFAGFLKWRNKNPEEADNQVSVCLFTD